MPNSYGNGSDRRPWVIISKREALALLHQAEGLELDQANHQLRVQLKWVDGRMDGERPSIARALHRDLNHDRATA